MNASTEGSLVDFQLAVSTAEEEKNYFFGQPVPSHESDPEAALPAGIYRVIDGQLYRVLPGAAPIPPPEGKKAFP